jgi:hypothetical protein
MVVENSEVDLATAVVVRYEAAADEGAHCVHKKEVEEFGIAAGVAADHTVAADCMLVERSWDDSSEQTKEQVEEDAAWEAVEGVVVAVDRDAAGHAAESVDRSATADPSSHLHQGLVDLAGQELEDLCMVQNFADH